MIRYEFKQLYRTPLRVAVLLWAFAVMCVAVTVSTGLELASTAALAHVESQYVTIAQPVSPVATAYDTLERYMKARNEFAERQMLFRRYAPDMVSVETYTEHSAYGAYGEGITPLTYGYDTGSSIFTSNRPNNLVVLAVRCERADQLGREMRYGKAGSVMSLTAYRMAVEEVVLAHEDITVAPTTMFTTGIVLEDGSLPFTEGERYLIWGLYDAASPLYGKLLLPTEMESGMVEPVLQESEDGIHLLTNYWSNDDPRPIIARLGSLTAKEMMESASWENWGEVMEIAHASVGSLRIFSTDRVLVHSAFMKGQAQLVAGRDFTDEELERGDRVCILNADLAERNGLSLGDTVSLNFYITLFTTEESAYESATYPNRLYTPEYRKDQVDAESGDYVIVGLYQLDGRLQGSASELHHNTVLVPQSALHLVYTVHKYSTFTVVLPNGGIDAFEEEVATLGLDLKFQYDDQGYAETVPHLTMLNTSIRAIHRLCICLWALVMAVLIMIYLMMQNAAAQVKFRVGASRGRIFGHTLFGGLLLLAVSSALGGGASVLLYNTVLKTLMDSDFTVFYTAFGSKSESAEILNRVFEFMQQSPETLIRICALQLGAAAVLLILSAAWLYLRPAHYRK